MKTKIYKELNTLGFFKWYCAQYGGLNYQEYKSVYDDLPLDNLIRTELNACAFKFFRIEYKMIHEIIFNFDMNESFLEIECKLVNIYNSTTWYLSYSGDNPEEAEFECLQMLIEIIKSND